MLSLHSLHYPLDTVNRLTLLRLNFHLPLRKSDSPQPTHSSSNTLLWHLRGLSDLILHAGLLCLQRKLLDVPTHTLSFAHLHAPVLLSPLGERAALPPSLYAGVQHSIQGSASQVSI